MIEVVNLSKKFKNNKGVKNLNFNIEEKDIVGFIGDNGAGKTTTLKLLFSELKKDYGEILFAGKPIKHQEFMRQIAFFPDLNNIPLDFTVEDLFEYNSKLAGICKNEISKNKKNIFDLLFLNEYKNKKLKHLSAGLKKRSIMACCLSSKPKYIFFDEPTANLDVSNRLELIGMIKFLNSIGVTIFITSHNLDELQEIISKLIIINNGEIIYNEKFNLKEDNISKIYSDYIQYDKYDLNKIKDLYEK